MTRERATRRHVDRATPGHAERAARAHVDRLLGAPGLDRLVERIRGFLESGGDPRGTVTLSSPSERERIAIARLLGRHPSTAQRVRVPLPEVEAVLRRSGAAPDLPAALAVHGGPLRDAPAERAAIDRAWREAHDALQASVTRADGDERSRRLSGWIERVRGTGLLKRLAGSDPERGRFLAERAAEVIRHVPSPAPVPRSVLAARHAGSGHALDDDSPLETLVMRAIASLLEIEPPRAAADRRRAWRSVGVVVGGVETPVLVLGVRARGASATARALTALAEAGEPAWLTARQLEGDAPAWDASEMFTCENACVVTEASARLGCRGAPLICLGGHPSAAAVVLLEQLRGQGVRVHHHGDFDWGGITITNGLVARHGVLPWRMRQADYEDALRAARRPLTGRPVEPTWAPGLGEAMRRTGLAVEEELTLDRLLDDLGR